MNYPKHFFLSLTLALIVGVIGYFIFGYLPFDCAERAQLTDSQALECLSKATLGLGYWLPFALFFSCISVLFYWAIVLASGLCSAKICKKRK